MAWYNRIPIYFNLVRIYLKLLVAYLNPWSPLYRHSVIFFLARKARRVANDQDETVDESELIGQVSLMHFKRFIKYVIIYDKTI